MVFTFNKPNLQYQVKTENCLYGFNDGRTVIRLQIDHSENLGLAYPIQPRSFVVTQIVMNPIFLPGWFLGMVKILLLNFS